MANSNMHKFQAYEFKTVKQAYATLYAYITGQDPMLNFICIHYGIWTRVCLDAYLKEHELLQEF